MPIGVQSAAAGMGYGFIIGIFVAGGDLIRFAVQPLTTRILWMWIAGGLIEFAILGALVGAIYKPQPPKSATQPSVADGGSRWPMGKEG